MCRIFQPALTTLEIFPGSQSGLPGQKLSVLVFCTVETPDHMLSRFGQTIIDLHVSVLKPVRITFEIFLGTLWADNTCACFLRDTKSGPQACGSWRDIPSTSVLRVLPTTAVAWDTTVRVKLEFRDLRAIKRLLEIVRVE